MEKKFYFNSYRKYQNTVEYGVQYKYKKAKIMTLFIITIFPGSYSFLILYLVLPSRFSPIIVNTQ